MVVFFLQSWLFWGSCFPNFGPAAFYTPRVVLRRGVLTAVAGSVALALLDLSTVAAPVATQKVLDPYILSFSAFLLVFLVLGLFFGRRRRGRYVAHVALRVAVLVALVLRVCLLAGYARACLWWVGFFLSVLSLLVSPFLPSCFFLVPFCSLFSFSSFFFFSLSLYLSSMPQPEYSQQRIWGGHGSCT